MKKQVSRHEFVKLVQKIKPITVKDSFFDQRRNCIICRFIGAGMILAESVTRWLKGNRYTEYFAEEGAKEI